MRERNNTHFQFVITVVREMITWKSILNQFMNERDSKNVQFVISVVHQIATWKSTWGKVVHIRSSWNKQHTEIVHKGKQPHKCSNVEQSHWNKIFRYFLGRRLFWILFWLGYIFQAVLIQSALGSSILFLFAMHHVVYVEMHMH